MSRKVNILVVDDSRTTRQMMTALINRSADMCVVGEAGNGTQAVQLTGKLRPDVILMDIVMPEMDGLQATREIMRTRPTPIVLVSASLETYETDIAFKAMKAGALTVLQKPPLASPNGEAASLLNTLRAMATVQVIHHWSRNDLSKPTMQAALTLPAQAVRPDIVAIASSTGGPAALGDIVRSLPESFAPPVVIVQHIAPDFVPSLVGWLGGITRLRVEMARAGETPLPSTVYLAPGGAHLRLNTRRVFELDLTQGAYRHMPSCDVLLESVSRSYGKSAVGVVLTGMGDDGARGLKAMYDAGAFTIAQDESTSVVFGMPQEAIKYGAACQVLPLPRIGPVLTELASRR